ncbi:MAG: glycoside hydrolase, partial [Actinomycetota bacterium]|nr:glycoside hydrolase [Actinomycetota bacterium]
MKRLLFVGVLVSLAVIWAAGAGASTPGADVRLTNDCVIPATPDPGPGYIPPPGCPPGSPPGYVSAYTLATGVPYTDAVLDECSIAHGRQNEPAIAVDPRDTRVLIGSSNDYCGVFVGRTQEGVPIATGPVWLGYYRSEDSGASFLSSLVPGYPGDVSPFAALSEARTAGSGDPVIAWDNEGRVFMGSESSGDPAGTNKSFGDVWVARYVNPDGPGGAPINDGKRYAGTEVVARGSSSPFITGKFHDKTAIEVDRTGGPCDGNVYFSWSRFTGAPSVGFNSAVYFVRSTDHGETFSHPIKLSETVHDIQFPDISVTGNGNVYVTFRRFQSQIGQIESDAIIVVKSTDCGRTFSAPQLITTFEPYDPA